MGVEGLAVTLASKWGVDVEKTLLAALLHDYAKGENKQILKDQLSKCEDYPPSEEDHGHPELWHGLVAAEVAKREFGINDPEIRQAIAYHTTGIDNYSDVGLVLYVADTLEPTRRFPHVEEKRREIFSLPLREAVHAAARIKLELLQLKHREAHGNTIRMVQWLDSPSFSNQEEKTKSA